MSEPADKVVICQVAVVVVLDSVPIFTVGVAIEKRPLGELRVSETLDSCVLDPVFALFSMATLTVVV